MNICFYTVDTPSAASLLNMSHLIQSRPGHNYSFLSIKTTPPPKAGLIERLKKKYGEMRFDDGRFDHHRDLVALDNRLKGVIQPLDRSAFRQGAADAVNDEKSVRFLTEIKPDLIIQAGAGIMKPETFTQASRGTINLHHGLSPEVRGVESTFWCMFYGIKEKIGVTCHFIDETLDTGAIIRQQALNSSATSFIDIQFENYLLGRDVLVQSVDVIDKGAYTIKSHGNVQSYYFGVVNPFLYYALKKRLFTAVMKISDRAFKMKEKLCVE